MVEQPPAPSPFFAIDPWARKVQPVLPKACSRCIAHRWELCREHGGSDRADLALQKALGVAGLAIAPCPITFQTLSLPVWAAVLPSSISSPAVASSPAFLSPCLHQEPSLWQSAPCFSTPPPPRCLQSQDGELPAPNSARQEDERYCFSGGIASKTVHLQSKCCLECI